MSEAKQGHPVPRRRCLVIGGGVAGLTAAYTLGVDPSYDVVLLEATRDVGGKIRRANIASIAVDVGAEAMLNRRPEGVALARELDLEVIHPTAAQPRLWSHGRLRPLPRTFMGVPQDLDSLAAAGVLTSASLARVSAEEDLPPSTIEEDLSVGALVAARMGREVVDRLVEPLLGGVYAGRADELSACAVIPGLVDQAQRGSWLRQAPPPPVGAPPVFAGIPGGMGLITEALAQSGRFAVRTEVVARRISRNQHGFEVEIATPSGISIELADDLILATPAAPTAKLLQSVVPVASAELAEVESASVVIVTLAVPHSDVATIAGSGFLVPPVETLGIKAATFSWAKWDWVRAAGGGQVALLRASWGRHREESALQRTDEELVALTVADLETAGVSAPLLDAHVQRWGGGLPQYAVGHLERVRRVRAAIAQANLESSATHGGRLAVCGAAYDGVGIPAVIGSAQSAVSEIAAQ